MGHSQMFHKVMLCMVAGSVMGSLACGSTIDAAEGEFDDEASADGSGGDMTTGPIPPEGPLEPGECITDYKNEDTVGIKHQCAGTYFLQLSLDYQGDSSFYFLPMDGGEKFGPGHEPYEQAHVMACCGPHDPNLTLEEQPAVAENCMFDARQQICISITNYMAMLINVGEFAQEDRKEALALQGWIADHTTECIAGLVDENPDYPTILNATWDIPDSGAWTPEFSNVRLTVAFVTLSDVFRPPNTTTCHSLNENNGDAFHPAPTPIGPPLPLTLTQGSGALFGPDYGSGPITAAADFGSTATHCSKPWCSHASLSQDKQGNWSIDAMTLHVAGELLAHDNLDSEPIEHARVELQASAPGHWSLEGGTPVYRVPPGAAQFLVVGRSADEWVTLPLPNSSEIVASIDAQGHWSFAPFEIAHRDHLGQPWTLQIQATRWASP